jgi:fructokinase
MKNQQPCRIAVFGEMLVDQFEAGPVVGGAPFNVARHLAAFGEAPLMIGAVGDDAPGRMVMAEFERYGMRQDGVQLNAALPTGVVDVLPRADGGHEFVIRSGCAWDAIGDQAADAALSALDPKGWLYCGTLALRSAVSRATGLKLLRAHPGPKYLDLNWREGHVERETALQAARLADVLKVNDEELEMLRLWLGGSDGGAVSIQDSASLVLEHLPLEMLMVTCGGAGALAFNSAGRCIAHGSNTRQIRMVDTVGAGDSFSAVVLCGLLRGWSMPTTLSRANAFAGHICEVRGAVPAQLADYASWTSGWDGGQVLPPLSQAE